VKPQALEPTKPITLLMTVPVVNLKGELWRARWKIVHPATAQKPAIASSSMQLVAMFLPWCMSR
jgi:hypothetical protein